MLLRSRRVKHLDCGTDAKFVKKVSAAFNAHYSLSSNTSRLLLEYKHSNRKKIHLVHYRQGTCKYS